MSFHALFFKGRMCVVDAKGRDVFCGDTVADCYCERHQVIGFCIVDEDHAFIRDEEGRDLIPYLVEKAS